MRIDQLQIKISGKAYTDKELAIDQEVSFFGKGQVVKKEITTNQDGSVNICAIIKPTQIQCN